jgi:hypothetical protein
MLRGLGGKVERDRGAKWRGLVGLVERDRCLL